MSQVYRKVDEDVALEVFRRVVGEDGRKAMIKTLGGNKKLTTNWPST